MSDDVEQTDPVDVDQLATDIHKQFQGRSPTLDDVIRFGLFKPNVLESHVSKALTKLKRSKRITQAATKYREKLTFTP